MPHALAAAQAPESESSYAARWRGWLTAAAAVAGALWLLAPSVAWFDSGELAAAAVQLGVPHPTGMPLFCLSGHTLAQIPLANAALRVHALGLLCAIGAAWLWLGALNHNAVPVWRAATGLLMVAVPALALHVRASEVYATVWLLTAAALWVWVRMPVGQRLWAMAVLGGLGAGVHVEAGLVAAMGWLASLVAWQRERQLRWRAVAGSLALGAAIAAMAIAYLPLAAERLPQWSWGDVRSARALWDHLTAATIRHAYRDRMGGGWADWAALGHLIWRDGAWLLAPAGLGAVAAWRLDRRALAATLAVALTDAVYSVLVNPMGLRDDQAGLVVLVALVVLAGLGVATAAQLLAGRRAGPWWAAVVLLAAGGGVLAARPEWGQRDLQAGARYADALLRRAGPGQLAITAGDHASAACAWLQTAEGVRPDTACVPGVFFRDDTQLAQVAGSRDRSAWQRARRVAQPGQRMQAWLQPELQAAPVLWQPGLSGEDSLVGAALVAGLPLSQLRLPVPTPAQARTAALQLPDVATQQCAQASGDAQCRGAPTLADALAADLAVHTALWARHDPAVARVLGEAAVALSDQPKALHNLAVLLVHSDPQRALQLARRAVQRQPDYLRAHRVAARAALQLGDVAQAGEYALAAMAGVTPAERQLWWQELVAEAQPHQRSHLREILGL